MQIKRSAPIFVLSFILLDQIVKYIIRLKGGFYICNKGIAFGINIPKSVFLLFWIIIIGLIILAIFKRFKTLDVQCSLSVRDIQCPALYLVLSGAISNIIDRLYFGCVVDFIDLPFWPIFNLADIFITVGVIMLILKTNKK